MSSPGSKPGWRPKKSKKTRKAKRGGNSPPANGGVIPTPTRRSGTDITASWMPVFPARTSRKLRYSTSFNLAGTAGVVASYVLAANGLYDPDITGSGHQPMGFDQMMLSYQHYVVTSCKLKVTFHNNVSTSTPVVSVKVDGGATPSTVVDTIIEFGLNTHSTLEVKTASGSTKVLESSVSIRKFEGAKDVVDVTDLHGSVAANPAELTYFHVQCWDNTSTTTAILCEVVMEFSAVFLEPRVLTPSVSGVLMSLLKDEETASKAGREFDHVTHDETADYLMTLLSDARSPVPGFGVRSHAKLQDFLRSKSAGLPREEKKGLG